MNDTFVIPDAVLVPSATPCEKCQPETVAPLFERSGMSTATLQCKVCGCQWVRRPL